MTDAEHPIDSATRGIPLRISLVYAVAGGLWILFSDLALSALVRDPLVLTRFQIFKGWAFIALTGLMLYLLLLWDMARVSRFEKALIESEEKFRVLGEATASAIFIYRRGILHVNPAMVALTGYSEDELLRMSYLDIVHPDFREQMHEHCEALAAGGNSPLRCEHKIVTKSGEEKWVDFTSSTIHFHGETAGLGTAYDLTEHVMVLDALRESEERFRLLIERVSDYEIFMLDQEGRIVIWNIGAERSKGYGAGEVIGRHHSIFFTEEDIKKGVPEMELKTAAETGKFEDEGWRKRKDGSLFWANVLTTALHDNSGELKGYSKVVRDMTERKKAEDALKESEERYRVITQTAADAIVTIDQDSVIIVANRAVKKVFGYEPEELIGNSVTMLMPERLRKLHLEGVSRYLQTGRQRMKWETLEFPGLHREKREVPLEISYGEFVKEDRHYFSGIIRDISERRQSEKEKEYQMMLERFNQELEVLVAERTISLMALTLADRIRTPAAVIGWSGRKLVEREGLPEKAKRDLAAILDEAERLEAIVKEFQTLLKVRKPVFSYVDINEITREVLDIISRETGRKGVELVVELEQLPLKVNAERDLLRMAVFNVLRNAVEATPEGGRISVLSSTDGENVVLSVQDTGHGIPRDVLDKIFDPFYSSRYYRFGMGLPLIKQVVNEHLGEIEVSSESGKGTTITMTFPIRWLSKAGRGLGGLKGP